MVLLTLPVYDGTVGPPGESKPGGTTGASNNSGEAPLSVSDSSIREVWSRDLDDAIYSIQRTIEDFPYVSIDTEFPGIVARPVGPFRDGLEYNYHRMKANVDLLRVIQVGLAFCDAEGKLPTSAGLPHDAYQFNFAFNQSGDMCASDAISFLTGNGVNFSRHEREGIDPDAFAEALMTSGIVLSPRVRWVSFQGRYDFAYFLKVLTGEPLPSTTHGFSELLATFCPTVYDIKWLMRFLPASVIALGEDGTSAPVPQVPGGCTTKAQFERGLEYMARVCSVRRTGQAHQAGSDALVTALVFHRLCQDHFPSILHHSRPSIVSNVTPSPGEVVYSNESSDVIPTTVVDGRLTVVGGYLNPKPKAQAQAAKSTAQAQTAGKHGNAGGKKEQSATNKQQKATPASEVQQGAGSQQAQPASHQLVEVRNILHGLGRGYVRPDRDVPGCVIQYYQNLTKGPTPTGVPSSSGSTSAAQGTSAGQGTASSPVVNGPSTSSPLSVRRQPASQHSPHGGQAGPVLDETGFGTGLGSLPFPPPPPPPPPPGAAGGRVAPATAPT